MKKEDEIFIELLKFGTQQGLNGIKFPNLLGWASDKQYIDKDSINDFEKFSKENQRGWYNAVVAKSESGRIGLLWALFSECFQLPTGGTPREKHDVCVLKSEYYFRLIEYKELQEARTAAREANKNAEIAHDLAENAINKSTKSSNKTILVSLLIGVMTVTISIYTSHQLSKKPININESQVEKLRRTLPIYETCGPKQSQ